MRAILTVIYTSYKHIISEIAVFRMFSSAGVWTYSADLETVYSAGATEADRMSMLLELLATLGFVNTGNNVFKTVISPRREVDWEKTYIFTLSAPAMAREVFEKAAADIFTPEA